MNTTENNKLISEFMGGKMITNDPQCKQMSFLGNSNATPPTEDGFYTLSMLKYHSSWDWLMSVVEKIESLDGCDYIKISPNAIEIQARLKKGVIFRPAIFDVSDSKIEAVYNACIAFIEWYNKQK